MNRLQAILAGLLLAARAHAGPEAAIYAGGPLYAGGAPVLAELAGSGFTTVVAWTLHLGPAGDLIYNDRRIVADGRYLGDPAWGERLARLKRQGSVRRLLMAVGSGGVQDFAAIRALLRAGDGPDSPLGRNFRALLEALPAIDGFDLDDEDLYDPATTVAFSLLLGRLGRTVSFCPFQQPGFWVRCLTDLEARAPGLVTAFHLQCYAGGWANQPADWIQAVAAALGPGYDAAGLVQPGLWGRHGEGCQDGAGPDQVAGAFAAWKPLGLRGGFLWLYDDLRRCQAPPGDYARALLKALPS